MSLVESGVPAACFAEEMQPRTHGAHQNHTTPILPPYIVVDGEISIKSKITHLIQRLWQL